MIRKSFAAAETKVLDGAQGLVETVFSVTGNTDRQMDIIEPGAFVTALSASRPPTVVYGHQWDDIHQVLGQTKEWQELAPGDYRLPQSLQAKGYGGVRAVVQFDLETPAGQLGFTHVKNGNLPEWSFAFEIAEGGSKYDEKGIRHISAIREVMEISLVLMGANQDTATVGFKAYTGARRERYEDALEIAATVKAAQLIEVDAAEPLALGLEGINAQIAAELAEPAPEYAVISQLCDIARDLQAGNPAEVSEPEPEAPAPEGIPAWMDYGLQIALTPEPELVLDNTTPQADPAVMHLARAHLRRTSN